MLFLYFWVLPTELASQFLYKFVNMSLEFSRWGSGVRWDEDVLD
jgi:hypothetical protein